MDEDTIRFTIAVDDRAVAEDTAESARAEGANDAVVEEGGRGVVPLAVAALAIVGTMAVSAFGTWLYGRIRALFKKGVLIRVTDDGQVQVTEIPIPYGQVIAIGPDGQWFKYVNVDDVRLGELTGQLTTGVLAAGGIKTSQEEVEAEVGEVEEPEEPEG